MNKRVLCYTSGTSSQGKRGLTSCVVEDEPAPWRTGALHVSAATQMDSALRVYAVLSGSVHEVLLPCVCVKLSGRGPTEVRQGHKGIPHRSWKRGQGMEHA